MTTFPTLIPSTRTFTPGFYPYTPFTGMSGRANRVRNSNAMLESQLRLTFAAITETEMLSILTHYNGQQGSFASFVLPTSVWSGGTAADFQLTGYSWIYKEPPTVEDLMCGGHNVELLLETVPPEGISLPGGSNTSGSGVTPGTVTTAPGGTGSVTYELDAGLTAVGGFSGTISYALTGGGSTDPDFANVSLLMHFDGSNGGTTFEDNSTNEFSITKAAGTVTTSTTQVKFGSAAGDFTTGGRLQTPDDAAFTFDGDFTIELWVYRTGMTGSYDTVLSASGESTFMLRGSTTNPTLTVSGTSITSSVSFTLNSWDHFAVVRSGSTVTLYKNGTSVGNGTKSGTITCTRFLIGDSSVNGRFFKGYIDDLRITKGVARYTENFTPPTAPFPDS